MRGGGRKLYMNDCPNLAACPFVKYCEEHDATMSVKGFITMYCRGERQEECIRKQLCDKFGRQVVPVQMMPNGYPRPGSKRDDWSEQALHFRDYLT